MDNTAQLERELSRTMGRCIAEYGLVADGDRIMVCLSGGKDSYTMMTLLERFRRRAPIRFELIATHLDQGQPNYDGRPLEAWLKREGFRYEILREDTYSVVMRNVPAGATYCSLCSRLRRGVLYNAAEQLGCSKIALGHHRDDAIETLLLNLLYTGSLRAMPPKLVSDDGRNTVIRPLLYAGEAKIARYAESKGFPILPCDLCGSQEQLKRKQVKKLLEDLTVLSPRVRESMLAAITNVRPSQLADADLWRKLDLPVSRDGQAADRQATDRQATAQPPPGPHQHGGLDQRAGEVTSAVDTAAGPTEPDPEPTAPPPGLSAGKRLPLLQDRF